MIPTSNPHADAELYFDDLEAGFEAEDARDRVVKQSLEKTFYETLEQDIEFPGGDVNTFFDLVCDDLESMKAALGWMARHRNDNPDIQALLKPLCDSYVRAYNPD